MLVCVYRKHLYHMCISLTRIVGLDLVSGLSFVFRRFRDYCSGKIRKREKYTVRAKLEGRVTRFSNSCASLVSSVSRVSQMHFSRSLLHGISFFSFHERISSSNSKFQFCTSFLALFSRYYSNVQIRTYYLKTVVECFFLNFDPN